MKILKILFSQIMLKIYFINFFTKCLKNRNNDYVGYSIYKINISYKNDIILGEK